MQRNGSVHSEEEEEPRAAKTRAESADAFIRRLDAHRQAPDAIIPPLAPPETDLLFAKRMIATKGSETPNVILLPLSSRERTRACTHACIPHVYGMCIACMHR